MRGLRGGIAACLAVVAAFGATAASAHAQTGAPPTGISVANGETQPVFDYDQAIRERVYIPNGQDADDNGVEDRTAIEIMRPKESGPNMKVPVAMEASPYWTTVCAGLETQCIGDVDGDGINDKWPLFYDNFFVPRGYAWILAEMDGTGNSTGCPTTGGVADVQSIVAVIDWLNGRRPGYRSVSGTSDPVVADWHDGKTAMIGKSYDGTLPNAVAATGVQGLSTIISISSIASWYDYTRMGGIVHSAGYAGYLAGAVDNGNPLCKAIENQLNADEGDATGDMNDFWVERDYLKDAGNVQIPVFETAGLQDDNVWNLNFSEWWQAISANDVPRKLWLLREGHADPFNSRRDAWVDTLHKWLDHWLYGVDNDVMTQPRVDIEDSKDTWNTYGDWPIPGSQKTDLYLQGGDAPADFGHFGGTSGGPTASVAFTDQSRSREATAMSIASTSQANRRVFLSPPLKQDLRLSGVPEVDMYASLDKPQSNLGAIIVDYGDGKQITRTGDGFTLDKTQPKTCVGQGSTRVDAQGNPIDYSNCYYVAVKPTVDVTATAGWRISRGVLDTSNRDSLFTPTPIVPGVQYEFKIPMQPVDSTIPAGHRLGIVLLTNYADVGQTATTGATVTIDTKLSKVSLPILGGYVGAQDDGAFTPVTQDGDVAGTVPATMALTLAGSADFGSFTPGLGSTYAASTTANVLSTAGDATLSVADADAGATAGHLVNGGFSLAQPLQVKASSSGHAGAFAALGASTPLLAWSAPTANDPVTLDFQQQIGANEALRTGSYAKTLTFTLTTTQP